MSEISFTHLATGCRASNCPGRRNRLAEAHTPRRILSICVVSVSIQTSSPFLPAIEDPHSNGLDSCLRYVEAATHIGADGPRPHPSPDVRQPSPPTTGLFALTLRSELSGYYVQHDNCSAVTEALK